MPRNEPWYCFSAGIAGIEGILTDKPHEFRYLIQKMEAKLSGDRPGRAGIATRWFIRMMGLPLYPQAHWGARGYRGAERESGAADRLMGLAISPHPFY